MKLKTPFFIIEVEWLFLIVFFIFLFSSKVKEILFSFFICYLFIVFHEFFHMFLASILGKDVEKFKITLAGVCIEFKKEKYKLSKNKYNKVNCIKNILIYVAGPLSNFILAYIFRNIEMIYQVNLFFAIINLMPLYPLDGYNIFVNFLCLLRLNITLQEIIIKCIQYFLYFNLFIIGLMQFFLYKNPSIVIFLLYIFILHKKNDTILSKFIM